MQIEEGPITGAARTLRHSHGLVRGGRGVQWVAVAGGGWERDSQLPDRPAQPRVPLVLLSGFSTTATSATVRALRNLGLSGGSDDKAPMFAVAVPNALNKPLSVLIDEIQGDALANRDDSREE